ncbi:phosphotransferase family protein [Pelagicoccus mobilis]|uniref:Aminoglycoside phosphotransferase family protein n=1 Tax=Pelagicoccus mobilis TaxID=415221 RepID=A0A934RZ43_9BACT|nr:aminoglycoside phosphotransferase family protein [Pelagicoccus mobilis]MBK1880360.1 aminoglycoside phosphotransferase family protein [Pelagicoccus mobilis]
MKITLQETRDFVFQVNPDPEQLRTIVERELTKFGTPASITEISGGLFNTAYRVDLVDPVSNWILRLSPAPEAEVFYNELQLMEREADVEKLFSSLGSVFPKALTYNLDRAHINRAYSIHQVIEGELWDFHQAELSRSQNEELWTELSQHARKIHSVEGDFFGYPGPSKKFSKWSDFIKDVVDGLIDDAKRFGLVLGVAEAEAFRVLLDRYSEILDEVDTPYLCHGDLWPKNILFQKEESGLCSITGVLDSERAFWGDPAAEWVFVFLDIPDSFWTAYGKRFNSESDRTRVQIYKGLYCTQVLLEAKRFGRSGEEEKAGIEEVLAELG